MDLSEQQVKEIAAEVVEQLRPQISCESPDDHGKHHDWVEQRIKDEEDIRAFRKKVIESAAIWAVISAIGLVALVLWKGANAYVKAGIVGS